MRKGIMGYAQESIAFQSDKLFKELAAVITAGYGLGTALADETYFVSPSIVATLEVIKRNTNIQYALFNGVNTGPMVHVPLIGDNVLISNTIKRAFSAIANSDINYSIRPLLNAIETKIVSGRVDLKNATVDGIYTKMVFSLFIPRAWFNSAKYLTAEEVAAIMLHEIGHTFTYLEYADRTMSTNQCLAAMVRGLDSTIPSDKREIIFAAGASLLKMNAEQQAALLNVKNEKDVGVIVLDAAIQLSISELGGSIYDMVSSEYLADQFAARHGAGRYLITGLAKADKGLTWHKNNGNTVLRGLTLTLNLLGGIAITALTLGTFWFTLAFMQDKESAVHDNGKSRILRIKHQNVERLKDKSISLVEKQSLLADNEAIDQIASFYDDNLSFIEKVAYFLRPSYRNAHKYELLQKALEGVANNSLFEAAAKFSTL